MQAESTQGVIADHYANNSRLESMVSMVANALYSPHPHQVFISASKLPPTSSNTLPNPWNPITPSIAASKFPQDSLGLLQTYLRFFLDNMNEIGGAVSREECATAYVAIEVLNIAKVSPNLNATRLKRTCSSPKPLVRVCELGGWVRPST